jgi:hypothetical protein
MCSPVPRQASEDFGLGAVEWVAIGGNGDCAEGRINAIDRSRSEAKGTIVVTHRHDLSAPVRPAQRRGAAKSLISRAGPGLTASSPRLRILWGNPSGFESRRSHFAVKQHVRVVRRKQAETVSDAAFDETLTRPMARFPDATGKALRSTRTTTGARETPTRLRENLARELRDWAKGGMAVRRRLSTFRDLMFDSRMWRELL